MSCEVQAGSNSGQPKELGTAPPYALLTLGDKRSTGTTSSLGVRNTEPGPFNGTNFFDFFTQPNLIEYGIKFDRSRVAGIFPTGSVSSWNVQGNVFSNSQIFIAQSPGQPVQVTPPSGPIGATEARGGCVGVTGCTTDGWDFTDGKGQDPGYTPLRQGSTNSVPTKPGGAALPVVTMDSYWLNARVAECSSGNHIVKFTPGIYTDAKIMNDLMGNAACKSATFWFQPDDNGTPSDTSDDTTGSYYFDFRNTTQPAYSCGQYSADNIFGFDGGDISKQWCIGGRAEDYGGQRVLGGTPYNWLPNANPTTHQLTLAPGAAGNGTGLFGLFQITQFSNTANAKTIDGTTVGHGDDVRPSRQQHLAQELHAGPARQLLRHRPRDRAVGRQRLADERADDPGQLRLARRRRHVRSVPAAQGAGRRQHRGHQALGRQPDRLRQPQGLPEHR